MTTYKRINLFQFYFVQLFISCTTILATAAHLNCIQVSNSEFLDVSWVPGAVTTVSEETFKLNNIKIENEEFKLSNVLSTSDSKELLKAKQRVFRTQAYRIMLSTLNVDVRPIEKIVFNADRSKFRIATQNTNFPHLYGDERLTAKWTAERKPLVTAATVINLFLQDQEDPIFDYDSFYEKSGKFFLKLYSFYLNDPMFESDFTFNTFLGMLYKNRLSIQDLSVARNVLERIPRLKIKKLIAELDLPRTLFDGLDSRRLRMVEGLTKENSILLGDARSTLNQIKEQKRLRDESQSRELMQNIKLMIRNRLDQDIAKNTSFKNFEELKSYILQFPQYRKTIEDFQKNAHLKIVRHAARRGAILLNGFRNVYETGTTSVTNSVEKYKQGRVEVEAAGLGIDQNDYLNLIPPTSRPKSTYVWHAKNPWYSVTRYGEDHYEIRLDKILNRLNSPVVTFTLGDSLDESGRWYTKPILAEDFPYFAAPFLHDSQSRSKRESFHTINYRQADASGFFPKILPEFFGGLETKLNVFVRSSLSGFEPNESIPTVITEGQVFGFMDIFDADSIAFRKDEFIPESLLQLYRSLGIKVIRY